MKVVGIDHVVLTVPDVEAVVEWYRDELGLEVLRLEEWRRSEVLFVSLRVSPTCLIDVMQGERTGENVNHVAFSVDEADVDEIAASGRYDIVMGPADLYGAQGNGRGVYINDPAGNLVELRTY
ncbi:MAG TPA: VOC family protein [Acidimicrobiales bacterium]|jgi:catechol 2,3-dioxygenase-like lactoylglutathione lyase family enzyme|nr:VOC family protein [Acidimicrobiales bacterium]